VHTYGLVHVFVNIIEPATGQVHKLLMCSWSVLFPFPWFSGGCVFSSCWLSFDVALCFRGLSPCVFIDFPGLGAVGFVCSGGRLCLDVAFTSGGVNASTRRSFHISLYVELIPRNSMEKLRETTKNLDTYGGFLSQNYKLVSPT